MIKRLIWAIDVSAARYRPLPYLLAAILVLLVLVTGEKFWSTNDDLHMAMIAHGYGIVAVPSPALVFSNVAWGWLVSEIGVVHGMQGYALCQYAALVLACGVACLQLYRSGAPGWLGGTCILAMFVPAMLDTQFTVTAGYLAVAGLASALAAANDSKPWLWILAAVLLVLSALIRFDEFAFVFLVASPFVALSVWRAQRRERLRWGAMLGASLLLIGIFSVVDRAYYSGPEWTDFNERTELAQSFVDYGLSRYYVKKRVKLRHSGLLVNDMRMLRERAFMDPKVFNTQRLAPLIKGVTAAERAAFNLSRWQDAMRPFRVPGILTLLVLAVLAAAFGRRREAVIGASLILLAAMTFFWLWGRPGIVHIYSPTVAALAVLGLIAAEPRRHLLIAVLGGVLFAVSCHSGWRAYLANRREDVVNRQTQAQCPLRADQLQVSWGEAGFGDLHLYRPLSSPEADCGLKLYAVSGLELLPTSLDQLRTHTGGKPLVEALLDGQSFYFLSDPQRLALLRNYLHSHYGVRLTTQSVFRNPDLHQFLVRVAPGPEEPPQPAATGSNTAGKGP